MKQMFYFIREPHKFTPDSVVYTVAVGKSQREKIKCELVRQWCHDTGAYFNPRSVNADIALDNLASSLFPSMRDARVLLRTKMVSVSQLYKLIINWSWDEIENDYSVSSAYTHQLQSLSLSNIFVKSAKGVKTCCQSVTRQYLSDDVCESPLFAAFNFGLILALFLFASWIDSLMY